MENLTLGSQGAKLQPASSQHLAGPPPGLPPAPATELGVYIHFPWCLQKCPYCDFLSIPVQKQAVPHDAYAEAILRELEARREELGTAVRLRSVFFGGGTPSLWSPAALGRVLRGIERAFAVPADKVEVTVECNPGTLDGPHASALAAEGVNRLSLGVQALDDERLRFLGRWHSSEHALRSLEEAQAAGIARVSADLIFATAGHTPEQAARETRALIATGIGHVSAYALTIEERTVFGAQARKGLLPLLPEAAVADCFLAVEQTLEGCGLEHYEVSNYARPGQQAVHNLGYWRGLDYVGLGCGAVGTVSAPDSRARRRYRNIPRPETYLGWTGRDLASIEVDGEPIASEVGLSEAIMLGLRLAEGIDTEQLSARFETPFWTPERSRAVERALARGSLGQTGARLWIPKAQWLLSDGIIAGLL